MGSPWEKYADPAATAAPWKKYAAPTAPAGPGQGDMRAPPAAPEQPGYAKDMLYSGGSGLVRGAVETAMLPITANRLGQQGASWAMGAGDDLVRSIFGMAPATPEDVAARQAGFAQSQEAVAQVLPFGRLLLGQQAADAQDAVRGAMDANLYEPQTTPGRYAETIGEFASPGGVPSKAVRAAPTAARKVAEYIPDLFRNVVLPGGLSEAAGQAAEGMGADGTWKETLARVAGAVAGGVGSAAVKAANAPDRVIRRAAGDVTDEEWARALELQNNQFGVKLTGPEAISQARNGGTGLTDVQRVVEGSIEGAAGMNPFFAQRPDQLKAATNAWLDSIAPQSAAPSTLGPRAAQAAEGAISASPEGRAMQEAIFGVGPRVTAAQAGEVVQPALRSVFDRREGMRNALSDQGYDAARASDPTIPVTGLPPTSTVAEPGYTAIQPRTQGSATPTMVPKDVPAQVETPAMTSRTGADKIQVDARPVVQAIDSLIPNARAGTQDALRAVRSMLFDKGGVDTGVTGLDAARGEIGDMIAAAKAGGQMQAADRLLEVQKTLDEALAAVPDYKAAKDTFAAASAPLAPFQSPGMASVVQKDQFNKGFATPPENVTGAVTSPSEARNFNAVAPPDARVAVENALATKLLDGVTDANGAVNGEALALALRSNEDVLSQFPAVRERLQGVVDAGGAMGAARQGPVGQIAAAKDTTAAGNALLPPNPLVGSEAETADAIRRLIMQDADTTRGLARQTVADRFGKAMTETQAGNATFGGAKFRKAMLGNDQRKATLDEALAALQVPEAAAASPALFDVMQATGRRKPIGSQTEFNRSINADLGEASPIATAFNVAKTAGVSWLTKAGDALQRTVQRKSLGDLADMFTDPQSVELIKAAIARGAHTGIPEAVARTAAQIAATRGQ